MQTPEAVLFDLDGTLLDSEPLWLVAEQRVMANWAIEWTEEHQQVCLGGPLDRVSQYMRDLIEESRESELPSEEEISQLLLTQVQHLFEQSPIQWRPGARELVTSIHQVGIPTAIVTASWRTLLDVALMNMNEEVGVFGASVAGDEVQISKPHPIPYLRAAELLNVDIVKCLAIEDSITGTTAAVSSGARTIAVEHLAPISVPGAVVIPSLLGHDAKTLWALFDTGN